MSDWLEEIWREEGWIINREKKRHFTWKLNVESIIVQNVRYWWIWKGNFLPHFFVASFLFPPNISVSISIQNSYMSTQNDWIMFLIIPQRTVFSCYRLNKRQNQISDGWINVSNFFWVRSDTCAYLIESILNLFMAFFFSFAQISFFSSIHCCLLLYLTYFRFSPSDKE